MAGWMIEDSVHCGPVEYAEGRLSPSFPGSDRRQLFPFMLTPSITFLAAARYSQ